MLHSTLSLMGSALHKVLAVLRDKAFLVKIWVTSERQSFRRPGLYLTIAASSLVLLPTRNVQLH